MQFALHFFSRYTSFRVTLSFRNCISCVSNCEDLLYIYYFQNRRSVHASEIGSAWQNIQESVTNLSAFSNNFLKSKVKKNISNGINQIWISKRNFFHRNTRNHVP